MTKPPAPAAAATPAPTSRLAPWQWWLLAAAVPIYLLASRLTLDLWADEVYTLYDFAAQPVARIISDYSAPNNHILYSLVLHPLALVTQREIWLRLPSLGFAIGTLLLVFRLALRTSGVTSAIAATLALGLNVMFLTHALQVRGYGLSMLLLAGLLELAIPGAPGPTRRRRLLLVPLVGAAFLYVLPTNALFLAPVGIAAVLLAWHSAGAADSGLRSWRFPWREGLAWFGAWPLALIAYWPVLDGVRAAAGGAARPLPWPIWRELVGNVAWAAGHDLAPLVLALPVVIYRLVVARRVDAGANAAAAETPGRKNLQLLTLVGATLAGPLALCWLGGAAPFVRNFCPLLPALALGVGWYVSAALGDRMTLAGQPDPRPALPWVTMALLGAVLLPPVLRYPARLAEVRARRFAQDGYYNYYAARFEPSAVARYLESVIGPDENFIVLYADGDQYNLAHYFAKAGLPLPPKRLRETSPGRSRAKIYCVVPELAHWDELARIAGRPAAELQSYPLAKRVGYYRIFASPEPVELELTAPPAGN